MSFRTGLIRAKLSTRHVVVRDISHTRLFARFNSQDVSATKQNQGRHAPTKSKIQLYVETLQNASGQPDIINQYYPALSWEATQSSQAVSEPISSSSDSSPTPTNEAPLSEGQLETMLETLAASGRPVDLRQIEVILADMADIFDMPPTADTHTAIIRGLLHRRNPQTVLRWFETMPSKPGGVRPTIEHYHMLLEAAPEFTAFKVMRNVLSEMRKNGCLPTNETYKILIRGLWKVSPQSPPPSHIIGLFEEMRNHGLGYDPSIPDLLSSLYNAHSLTRWSADITRHYNSIFASHLGEEKIIENDWIPRFVHTLEKRGLQAALDLYPEFEKAGGKPSSYLFNTLLRCSVKRQQMQQISSVLGLTPGVPQWSILITEVCRAGQMEHALRLYEESKAAGIVPDAGLIGPMLHGLFRNTKGAPPDHVLDTAIELYGDLKKASVARSGRLLSKDSDPNAVSPGPDRDIYNTLIRAFTRSRSEGKYRAFLKTLLADLSSQGIDVHGTAASITIIRMRLAISEKDAFREYQRRSASLDQKGYERVLDAFCRFSLDGRMTVPSLSLYFNIVQDMKKAGFQQTDFVYNVILRQFGQIGTRAKTDPSYVHLMGKLVGSTKRIHDLITLDSSIDPDATLWNHLMDTYQRLGCFADAWRVWDQMHISGRFDHVSVSIILDACGYAGADEHAGQVIQRLKRSGFALNLHNYNTWIECLCRLNKLNQALKVLCLEMVGQVSPDQESVRIIRSFAKRADLQTEVLKRIQRYHPQLYMSLPDVR
ncbi:hypothetical protein VNI00_002015 [Paramarasmius palmivorus]|uniref:Pentatricopeptide repeat-containing protein-mitochondrial domain-containing protein n=1 Tax=Paramarasmius palmivorus TaxID=297713 RepID=A0AAW0E513_9AGAR